MSVLLHFSDGQELELEVEPREWTSAFENALAKGVVIKIKDPSDGGTLGINPRLVAYWKLNAAS
jgi:hypothetical protein